MGYAVRAAKEAGAKVALNPSPINENLASIPMDLVDYFLVNEIEGKEISGAETEEPEIVMEGLKKKFPNAAVVLKMCIRDRNTRRPGMETCRVFFM